MRLFVAVLLPEQIKTEIEQAQTKLRRTLTEGCVRWARREQFHLTLKFLGDVETSRIAALQQALCEACSGFGSMQLRARKVGFFPDARRPRVVWVGLQGEADRLIRLQRLVERAVEGFTAEPREREFAGHITLGRVKRLGPAEAAFLTREAVAMAEQSFGEWTATSIDLMRSELAPQGARHTSLTTIALDAVVANGKLPPA